LARRKRVEVAELARERLLLLRKAFMTRQLFHGACQITHITPRIVIESGSPHALISLAKHGHGIAIIPSTVHQISAKDAIPVQIGARQLGVWMSVIWDPRRYLPPAAAAFIDEARRFTRRRYPGKAFSLGDLFDSSPSTGLANNG
jgi:DNA-binding transcriptional LysR family regulator